MPEDDLLAIFTLDLLIDVSGNIITGKGPALAMEFALALVEVLKGAEIRKQVAEGLLFGYSRTRMGQSTKWQPDI